MKRIMSCCFLIVLLLLVSGCAKGDVSDVHRKISDSSHYTAEEIGEAMDTAIDHFKKEFEGCTLQEMEYSEEHSTKYAPDWAEQYSAEEAIVLLSVFDVDSSGGDGSFNADCTYTGWQWVLTRSAGESWTLRTWGYG